jgi:hypothetical protein
MNDGRAISEMSITNMIPTLEFIPRHHGVPVVPISDHGVLPVVLNIGPERAEEYLRNGSIVLADMPGVTLAEHTIAVRPIDARGYFQYNVFQDLCR